jgi:hypothetical protein
MDATRIRKALGRRAFLGLVDYSGAAHAPEPGAHAAIDPRLSFSTVADSGRLPQSGRKLADLQVFLAAALYETGFAAVAMALSARSN